MEMQNSNPTILDAADLPTRRPATNSSSAARGKSTHHLASALSKRKNSNINKELELYNGTIFEQAVTSAALHFNDPFAADYSLSEESASSEEDEDDKGNVLEEPIDEQEIYDLISTISDPEHPISLGSLAVVSLPDIRITPSLPDTPSSPLRTVTVLITPTITHCSLATVIGLGVRTRLEQSLPPRFRVDVRIKPGTHNTDEDVNKQLADKERVAAALEKSTLIGVIGKMLETCQ